jgi:predicted HTH transcriptional regulator
MVTVSSPEELALLRETYELECKLAAGRHGQGQLPEDFWPTYSAFANTQGGLIILGIKEKGGKFSINGGLQNPAKVETDLFNQLNNRQKVSANILAEKGVYETLIQQKTVLVIEVPRASRKERPVYIGPNPMTGTYRRVHDGDRPCDAETVRRMLAGQVEDSRDFRILAGYDFDDLDGTSFRTYRQSLRDRTPGHPYLDKDDREFLRLIGGWRRDRETKQGGLTVAGLLMFGRAESIRDEFPNYFLDYQERPYPKVERRWVDRVTLDGTWSGNLFDFYRRVYRKLVADLKVPFILKDGQRQEETPVHVALREALVNCIVHADYTGRASILIVRSSDMFGFRNPGLMRVPVEIALAGGESDGRNRLLQQMFLLLISRRYTRQPKRHISSKGHVRHIHGRVVVGAGERAGSGVPKIHKGWTNQHWRPPALYEREEPSEQTLLELRMVDLLPAEAVKTLHSIFGAKFDELSPDQRLALATAATEQSVTHSRILAMCDQHPTDSTRMLQGLVQAGFLVQSGRTRGASYRLPGSALPDPDAVFGGGGIDAQGMDLNGKGMDLSGKGTDLASKGTHLGSESLGHGRQIGGLPWPLIDSLDDLDKAISAELLSVAQPVKSTGKVSAEVMHRVVLALCSRRYVTMKALARLMDRDEVYLRVKVLNPMVDAGALERAFPQDLFE